MTIAQLGEQLRSNETRFARFVEELEALVAAGVTCGVQAAIRHRGELVLDLAIGECAPGQVLLTTTPHDVYSALKPVTACAMLAALEAAGVGLDTRILDLLPAGTAAHGGAAALTLRTLLDHNAGLASPLALEVHWKNPDERDAMLTLDRLLEHVQLGDGAYSEVAAWWLLGAATPTALGREPVDVIDDAIAALGLADTFVRSEWKAEEADRIGCYFDMAGEPPIPLLHDRLPRYVDSDFAYGIGGYTTMADLSAWYAKVLSTLQGRPTPGLPSPTFLQDMVNGGGEQRADRLLRRECRFSGGFMVDVSSHFFGRRPSPSAFAHAGFLGNSFGFADPENDLSVALLVNGIRLGDAAAEVRRLWLVNCLYDDLEDERGVSDHFELPSVRIPGVAGDAPVRLPPFTGVAQPRYTPPAVDLDIEWHVGPTDFSPTFVWRQHFRAGLEVDGAVAECANRMQVVASYRDHVALVYGVVSLELAQDEPAVDGPLGALSAHAGLVQDPRIIGARGLSRAEIDAVVRWADRWNTVPELANRRG